MLASPSYIGSKLEGEKGVKLWALSQGHLLTDCRPIFLWPSRHTSACYEMAILADNALSIYIANVENISPFRLLKPPCNPTA